MLLQIMSIQSFLVIPKLKSQTKKKLFICICCMSYIFSFKITATDVTIVVAVVNKKDSYLAFLEWDREEKVCFYFEETWF